MLKFEQQKQFEELNIRTIVALGEGAVASETGYAKKHGELVVGQEVANPDEPHESLGFSD